VSVKVCGVAKEMNAEIWISHQDSVGYEKVGPGVGVLLGTK
jgi:hypothetical protein